MKARTALLLKDRCICTTICNAIMDILENDEVILS